MNTKSSRMGRPTVDSEQVRSRVDRMVLDAIDAYCADQADKPPRPEAIRRILRDGLERLGYLKP